MRLLAALFTLPVLLGWTLLVPATGLFALAVIYYMRPEIWNAPAWLSLVEIFTWATMIGFGIAVVRGRLRIHFSGVLLLMFLLVGWSWFSGSQATLSRTMGTARALLYLKCAIAGFLIAQLIDDPKKLSRFLWAVVIGTFWTVKSAIFLLVTKHPDRVNNIGGQGGGANFLALILVLSLPVLLYQLQGGGKRERLFAMALLPLWLLAMGLSGSRGGFLAMGVQVFFFIWMNRRKGLALVLVAVAGIVFVAVVPARYFDRMETIDDYRNDESAMGRIELWKGAMKLTAKRPVRGVGPENFALHSGAFAKRHDGVTESGLVAHSLYFQTLAEIGWPGFLLLLGLMGSMFLSFFRAGRMAPDTEDGRRLALLCRALTVSFIGFAAHSAVMSNLHRDFFWWWMGLAAAVPAIARRLAAEADEALETTPGTEDVEPAREEYVPAWVQGGRP